MKLFPISWKHVSRLRDFAAIIGIGWIVGNTVSPSLKRFTDDLFGLEAVYYLAEFDAVESDVGTYEWKAGAHRFYHVDWKFDIRTKFSMPDMKAAQEAIFKKYADTVGDVVYLNFGSHLPGRKVPNNKQPSLSDKVVTIAARGECILIKQVYLTGRLRDGNKGLGNNVFLQGVKVGCL